MSAEAGWFDDPENPGMLRWWDGERWVIESRGTLADGSETTAVNFLTRAGNDAFTWRSVRRTLDGKAQPDVGPVKVNRVK